MLKLFVMLSGTELLFFMCRLRSYQQGKAEAEGNPLTVPHPHAQGLQRGRDTQQSRADLSKISKLSLSGCDCGRVHNEHSVTSEAESDPRPVAPHSQALATA